MLDTTPSGCALTKTRKQMVEKYLPANEIVDIGIGGGRFVEAASCRGYDVNESAVRWLRMREAFCSPYAAPIKAITCWDSLEHIDKPWKLLKQVTDWLFVSLPIFINPATIVSSKHYKPGEHIWYFTHQGFINWCATQGFELVEFNHAESDLGREGITSYAFKRKQSC